jgi:putative ABC transport system ATP-binding protein
VPETILAVEQASVHYGPKHARTHALNGVSLTFSAGELTVVMGPSGSGKTTLLSVLGCLLRPATGRVFVNGQEAGTLSESQRTRLRRRNIGFIFQAFRLFHALSAFENVMLAGDIAGVRDRKHAERARGLLTDFGLGDKLNAGSRGLSGGEQQRVAIARALLRNPRIILADEPTASLDAAAGRNICGILRGLAVDRQHAVVVVSHDPRWSEFAHRTVVLEDGRVVQDRRNHDENPMHHPGGSAETIRA